MLTVNGNDPNTGSIQIQDKSTTGSQMVWNTDIRSKRSDHSITQLVIKQ
jgi:small ligand-binding sensory domain FIST